MNYLDKTNGSACIGMQKAYHSRQLVNGSKELFKKLPVLAKETGFIQRRSSKFSGEGFVLTLLKGVLSGKGSLNQLAGILGRTGVRPLSRQALWERVDKRAVSFMQEVKCTPFSGQVA